jgi:serine/threonine protein phosphatase PrpC
MLRFKSSSATHVGMVRKLNEDSFVSRDDAGLWAVADGMGGHQAGDLASQKVVHALEQVEVAASMGDLLRATRAAIHQANAELLAMASQFDSSRVPGSTVAALVIKDGEAAAVWAGDSRIYRLRDGEVQQITRDHSHVQELLDQHLISPEEAEHHPMANVITRAVGIEDPLDLDVLRIKVNEGDRFLICSDGLSRLLSPGELQGLLQTRDLQETVNTLLHTALVRGAPDNVTIVSIDCCGSEDDVSERTRVYPTA